MKKTILNNLEEIRQELWVDKYDKDAIDHYNAIIEYINTLDPYYYDLLITAMNELMDIVFDKDLEAKLKEQATSISRLKNYINDTVDDDIYQLDGYANLSNITEDNFDTLLLDLIDTVKED